MHVDLIKMCISTACSCPLSSNAIAEDDEQIETFDSRVSCMSKKMICFL